MSEVNGPSFSVNQVNFNSSQKQPLDAPQGIKEEGNEPKLKDFSNPTEVIGRSLVKETDNLNNDLAALIKNPQIAENSDEMFETAYKAAVDSGVENPYEEASSFATGAVK